MATLNYDDIDPALKPALDAFGPPLEVTRENVDGIRKASGGDGEDEGGDKSVEVTKVMVPRSSVRVGSDASGGAVPVYIYRKIDDEVTSKEKKQRVLSPALAWCHGGGYVLGDDPDDVRFMRHLASELGITVFSIKYRLAPEHPLNDCISTLHWMSSAEVATSQGIDTTRIAIGGVSAGAGLVAGVALANRDLKGPNLAFQLLLEPMIDNLHDTNSGRWTNTPIWDRKGSLSAWEMYLNSVPGLDAPEYAAVARAKKLSGLPPTYITCGTVELFRDEIIEYARKLMEAGVPCELAVFPGLYHVAWTAGLAPNALVSQRFVKSFVSSLRSALCENVESTESEKQEESKDV